MALSKQLIPVSVAQGINTKVDPKVLSGGALTRAENIVYDEIGAVRKRTGYSELTLRDLNNATISDSRFLSKFKNELLLFTPGTLYAYSETMQRFLERGPFYGVFPDSQYVVRNAQTQSQIDSVVVQGFSVYAYADSAGGIRYSIVDGSNGALLASNLQISATGERPQIAAVQNTVYIVYVDGTDIKYRTLNILQPETLTSEVLIANNVDATDKILEARAGSDRVFVAYNSNHATDKLSALYIKQDGTVSSTLVIAGEACSDALDILIDSQSRVIVSYSDGTDVKYIVLPYSLLAPLAGPFTLESIAGVVNVAAVECVAMEYCFYYEVSAAQPSDHYIKEVDGDPVGNIGTPAEVLRSVGLASKPFRYNDMNYLTVVHGSGLQSTYFVIDETGVVVTKFSSGIGGGLLTHGTVPTVEQLSEGLFQVPSQVSTRVNSETGTFTSVLGVRSTKIQFSISEPYQAIVQANNLHISGGILRMYDGNSVVEHGFHIYPETLADGGTATAGGAMSDGNYGYVAVYRWTDQYGQDHRSSESTLFEVVLSGGTGTQTQSVVVPTLRVTEKENVVVELYRTESNGTIYYRVTSTNSPIYNNPTVDSVTIVDTLSDAQLISREPLYTTGGVLENIGAPGASIVSDFQNRVVLAGTEDPNLLYFSKIHLEGFPVEFNDTLTIKMKDQGGPITALAEFNEKLVVFKREAVYFISGDGPNNLGEQDNFTNPEQISVDVGCTDKDSIAITPDGLFFKSAKGIYLLDAGLNLNYIGAPVEDYNDLTITSAKILPTVNQVRFTTYEGECLVYNYFTKMWSTFTNHEARSAETLNQDYYYIRRDGAVFKSSDTYSDNGSPIKMLVETGWMSFSMIQGYQRVYKMLLFGQYKSAHNILVSCAYDFNPAYVQTVSIDPEDFIDPTPYGGHSPYGSETLYGGDGNVYQARVDLKKQKCQSFRIKIEDEQAEASEGLTLTGVTMEVGVKTGLFKPNSNRKYGTS